MNTSKCVMSNMIRTWCSCFVFSHLENNSLEFITSSDFIIESHWRLDANDGRAFKKSEINLKYDIILNKSTRWIKPCFRWSTCRSNSSQYLLTINKKLKNFLWFVLNIVLDNCRLVSKTVKCTVSSLQGRKLFDIVPRSLRSYVVLPRRVYCLVLFVSIVLFFFFSFMFFLMIWSLFKPPHQHDCHLSFVDRQTKIATALTHACTIDVRMTSDIS